MSSTEQLRFAQKRWSLRGTENKIAANSHAAGKFYEEGSFGRFGDLCDACPPLRPAALASSGSREKLRIAGRTLKPPFLPAAAASSWLREKLRFSFGTLVPPLRAMARCFSGSIEAKPRVDLRGCALAELLPVAVPLVVLSVMGSSFCCR